MLSQSERWISIARSSRCFMASPQICQAISTLIQCRDSAGFTGFGVRVVTENGSELESWDRTEIKSCRIILTLYRSFTSHLQSSTFRHFLLHAVFLCVALVGRQGAQSFCQLASVLILLPVSPSPAPAIPSFSYCEYCLCKHLHTSICLNLYLHFVSLLC